MECAARESRASFFASFKNVFTAVVVMVTIS